MAEFRFGEGKMSGVISATLGALGFGAVLCLLYPSLLTTPDMREIYPMALVRGLIQFVLALAPWAVVNRPPPGRDRRESICDLTQATIANVPLTVCCQTC